MPGFYCSYLSFRYRIVLQMRKNFRLPMNNKTTNLQDLRKVEEKLCLSLKGSLIRVIRVTGSLRLGLSQCNFLLFHHQFFVLFTFFGFGVKIFLGPLNVKTALLSVGLKQGGPKKKKKHTNRSRFKEGRSPLIFQDNANDTLL